MEDLKFLKTKLKYLGKTLHSSKEIYLEIEDEISELEHDMSETKIKILELEKTDD